MKAANVKAVFLSALPLLFLGASAFSDQGVDVKITNDGTEDVVVTVYDMNVQPRATILSHARINGFTSVPLSVAMDENGRANLSWVAISADAGSRKCGHGSNVGPDESGAVMVHANSTCSEQSAGL